MTSRFKQALLEMKKSKKGRKGKMPKNFSVGSGDKSKAGGLTKKGVKRYRAANPGSKLKTAVTTKPSKLKKGSKAANRRKSFCKRMGGMKKKLTSKKTSRDPDSRINKALRKWNCSTDVNPNALQNMVENFYIDLAVEEFIEMHESQGTDIGDLHGDFLSESCSYWLDNVSQVREAFGNYVHPSRKGAATKPQDDPLQRMARGRAAGRAPRAQTPMKPKAASNFMGDTMKRGVSKKPIPKATPSRFGALGDIAKGFAGRYAGPARDAYDDAKAFMSDPKRRQKAMDAGKSRLKSFFNPKEIGRNLGGAARDVGRKIGGGVRSRLRGAGDRFKKFLNRRIIPDTQSKFESLSDYELDSLVEKFITSTEIVRNARQGLAETILSEVSIGRLKDYLAAAEDREKKEGKGSVNPRRSDFMGRAHRRIVTASEEGSPQKKDAVGGEHGNKGSVRNVPAAGGGENFKHGQKTTPGKIPQGRLSPERDKALGDAADRTQGKPVKVDPLKRSSSTASLDVLDAGRGRTRNLPRDRQERADKNNAALAKLRKGKTVGRRVKR